MPGAMPLRRIGELRGDAVCSAWQAEGSTPRGSVVERLSAKWRVLTDASRAWCSPPPAGSPRSVRSGRTRPVVAPDLEHLGDLNCGQDEYRPVLGRSPDGRRLACATESAVLQIPAQAGNADD